MEQRFYRWSGSRRSLCWNPIIITTIWRFQIYFKSTKIPSHRKISRIKLLNVFIVRRSKNDNSENWPRHSESSVLFLNVFLLSLHIFILYFFFGKQTRLKMKKRKKKKNLVSFSQFHFRLWSVLKLLNKTRYYLMFHDLILLFVLPF